MFSKTILTLAFGLALSSAALSDDEHRGTLENIIQQFGDVMTADEVLARLRGLENEQASPSGA